MDAPISRIKRSLQEHRSRRGLAGNVLVNGRELLQLIEEYDRLCADEELMHAQRVGDPDRYALLEAVIRSLFHAQGNSAERILAAVMRVVTPLAEERLVQREIDQLYYREKS